ncbi:hypothetical protein NDA01_17825 [Trichocoleus desertorum AS-A10]|uniref:hypothetical protein n=1 Tax=Trichocoleus desertorum TaxID=1481672 RepID=UPI00329942FA
MFRLDRRIALVTLSFTLGLTAIIQGAHACMPPEAPSQAVTPSPRTVASSPNILKDTLVVPGERIGPVIRTTTYQDLVKLFGKSRLSDRTVYGPEGIGMWSGTRVNLGLAQSFTVVWQDTKRAKPLHVRELGSAWKTAEGIGMCTPLTHLQKQLGKFQISGLDWDYGGAVMFHNTRLSRYVGKLTLVMQADPQASDKYPDDYSAVVGDRLLSSTDPHWKPLGMRVGSMIVRLNSEL